MPQRSNVTDIALKQHALPFTYERLDSGNGNKRDSAQS
jgi:hypothetical protein